MQYHYTTCRLCCYRNGSLEGQCQLLEGSCGEEQKTHIGGGTLPCILVQSDTTKTKWRFRHHRYYTTKQSPSPKIVMDSTNQLPIPLDNDPYLHQFKPSWYPTKPGEHHREPFFLYMQSLKICVNVHSIYITGTGWNYLMTLE
jgi:hypothetical protein